jgi:hypothetical protein
MDVLLKAVYDDDAAGVEAAVAAGANPNGPDEHLRTPLMWAAEWNKPQSMAALIAAGAKVETKGQDHITALLVAVESASVEAVKALIAAGADLLVRDAHKETPLTIALGRPLGFEERGLKMAKALADAMDEGAVRDELQRRLDRQQASLLKDRNVTVGTVNEVVSRIKEVGIDVLDDEERGKLKKMLEAGQAIEAEMTTLWESGNAILENLEKEPRKAVDGAFQYGVKHHSLAFTSMSLLMNAEAFLHQL